MIKVAFSIDIEEFFPKNELENLITVDVNVLKDELIVTYPT